MQPYVSIIARQAPTTAEFEPMAPLLGARSLSDLELPGVSHNAPVCLSPHVLSTRTGATAVTNASSDAPLPTANVSGSTNVPSLPDAIRAPYMGPPNSLTAYDHEQFPTQLDRSDGPGLLHYDHERLPHQVTSVFSGPASAVPAASFYASTSTDTSAPQAQAFSPPIDGTVRSQNEHLSTLHSAGIICDKRPSPNMTSVLSSEAHPPPTVPEPGSPHVLSSGEPISNTQASAPVIDFAFPQHDHSVGDWAQSSPQHLVCGTDFIITFHALNHVNLL